MSASTLPRGLVRPAAFAIAPFGLSGQGTTPFGGSAPSWRTAYANGTCPRAESSGRNAGSRAVKRPSPWAMGIGTRSPGAYAWVHSESPRTSSVTQFV
jgi:hypothetical protein